MWCVKRIILYGSYRVAQGVVLEKKCGNAPKELDIFSSISESFLSQFLTVY